MKPFEIICKEGETPTDTYTEILDNDGKLVGMMCIPNYFIKLPEGVKPIEYKTEVTGRDENGKPNKWIWERTGQTDLHDGLRVTSPPQF